jgi:hypothetical protein
MHQQFLAHCCWHSCGAGLQERMHLCCARPVQGTTLDAEHCVLLQGNTYERSVTTYVVCFVWGVTSTQSVQQQS